MRFKLQTALNCVIVILMLCGCQSQGDTVTARIQHNVDRCNQDFRSKSPIWRQFATNILSAVTSANELTLKAPRFASAAIGRDDDGEYRLHVYWLEDVPSVDGVELLLSKTNSTGSIAVSSSNTERNLKDSKVSVVFTADWIWSSTNAIWNQLEKINDVSNLKIRLLKTNNPVTEWCPLSFYRLDHWMGSKQVIQITNGNPATIKAN